MHTEFFAIHAWHVNIGDKYIWVGLTDIVDGLESIRSFCNFVTGLDQG